MSRLSQSLTLGIAMLVTACVVVLCPMAAHAAIHYTGVNLFGAEFGVSNGNINLPGTYGIHYTYPTSGEVDYFKSKGMNTFRLPFRWERLQRSQFATLHGDGPGPIGELDRMDAFVNYATTQGAYVILDPHNFQRYFPDPNNFQSSAQGLVGTDIPNSAYANFWSKVADHYKNNDKVIFNLMNEPNTMSTSQLVTSHNEAIMAIRATGAQNLILVPGNQWTGAWAWNETWYNGANSEHMLNIVDSANNFAFDVHQYLDSDSSGSSEGIVSETIGRERLVNFTNWLHANNRKGFLGEFAVSENTIGAGIGDEAINNMLGYIESNADVWLGWTWWAAGPWYTNYFFSLEPLSGQDRAPLAVLQPHFAPFLQGDYDYNGVVDGADYVLWRNGLGTTFTQNDYHVWRANFSRTSDSSSGARTNAAAPEPATLEMLFVMAAGFYFWHRRKP